MTTILNILACIILAAVSYKIGVSAGWLDGYKTGYDDGREEGLRQHNYNNDTI